MEIHKIIIHYDWSSSAVSHDADIAILVFEREIQFSDYIHNICLPVSWQTNVLEEGQVVGYGYSQSSRFISAEDTPKKIQMKKPPTNEFCFLNESRMLPLSSSRTFCGKGEKSGTGPCLGDSGF